MGETRSSDRLLELFIRLKTLKGDYLEAQVELNNHRFGTRHQSYSLLRLYQAVQLLRAFELSKSGSFESALSEIETANHPPANLGVDDFATLVSSRLLLFKALTYILARDTDSSQQVWSQAAQTNDQDTDGEGLFRAIGLFMSGERDEAEKWFDDFEMVNRQRKKDNDTSVKVHAYYLSGVYSIFRGDPEKGKEELELALQEDESNLFVRQALLWLDAGFFRF
jgi:tetratricopeptide (TPR) repeat protein